MCRLKARFFLVALALVMALPIVMQGAVNVGASSWIWQNPLPQADNLNAVSCPTANICYAVGELGTILATTNGGATWTSQSSTTNVTLRGISCPSTSTCVAVGDSGTILLTTTNGAAWSKQSAFGTTVQLTGISCPSTSECFAVGPSGVWGSLSLGSSWSQRVSSTGFVAISCPSASLGFPCYVAGHTTVAQLHGLPFFGSWKFYLSDTAAVPPIRGLTGLSAISCPNTSACVAVSNGGESTGANIIETTNGGSSWTPVTVGPVALSLNSVSCINTGSGGPLCYAVGYAPGSANNNQVFIGGPGANWTAVSGGDPFFSITDRNLNGISCSPALVFSVPTGMCFAVGNLGAIVTDTPSGFTWSSEQSSIEEPLTPLGQLSEASCPQAGTCYAVGNGFYATINGGAWTLKNSMVGGKAVSCPSTTDCFIGGTNQVLTTTDGGAAWTSQPLPLSSGANTIQSISCPSAQVCVAIGTQVAVFTTNGGSTWSLIGNVPGLGNSVSCPTTTMCIGVSGNVLGNSLFAFTTNLGSSGVTWTTGVLPTSNSARAVSCETDTHCIVVGDSATFIDGRLSASSNTWTWSLLSPPIPTNDNFLSVSCFLPNSNGLCYAGTFVGEIVSYTQQFGGAIFNVEAAINRGIPIQGMSCAGNANYECAAVGFWGTILTKTIGSVGAGVLIPSQGSGEEGDPTTFELSWTVPSPQVWHDLRHVDLKLVDDEGAIGLWARFIPGNPTSVFALLDAKGNIVSEGASGTPGLLDSPTATLDLSQSSFVGSGPTGPSVTVNFLVTFKTVDAGNGTSQNAAHNYNLEISAADLNGIVQAPEDVGSWVVRAIHRYSRL